MPGARPTGRRSARHHSPFPRRAVRAAGIGLTEYPSTPTSRERGASAVAEQSPSSDPLTSFGPNEWLVDELYEQYQKDRNSVDRAWWDFFKDYTPGEGALGRDAAAAANRATATRPDRPTNGAADRRPGQGADPGRRPRARTGHPPGGSGPRTSHRGTGPGPRPLPRQRRRPPPPPRRRRARGPSPRQPSRRSRARPRRPRRPARSATRRRLPSAGPAPASSRTWSPRSRCPPPPRCVRSPPSCSSTTASSSTTTSPAAAAAR